jgi:diacylglycerol kinase (ATP)
VALVFNPAAGDEDPGVRRSALEELAKAAGLTCELAETDVVLGAHPAAEKAVADGMERLIVCGGDGSVAEAAHALAGTTTSLAVVPGGTANLLAVNLGIPTDREEAMRFALASAAQPTDVARTNVGAFLIAAGMGLDARIMRGADRALKNRYGHLAYFISGWRNLGRPHQRYTIAVDGATLQRATDRRSSSRTWGG